MFLLNCIINILIIYLVLEISLKYLSVKLKVGYGIILATTLPLMLYSIFWFFIAGILIILASIFDKNYDDYFIKNKSIYTLAVVIFLIIYLYDIYVLNNIYIDSDIKFELILFDNFSFALKSLINHFFVAFISCVLVLELCAKYFENKLIPKIYILTGIIFGITYFSYVPIFETLTLRSNNIYLLVIVFVFVPFLWLHELNKKDVIIMAITAMIFGKVAIFLFLLYLITLVITKYVDKKYILILAILIFLCGNGLAYIFYYLSRNLDGFYNFVYLNITATHKISTYIAYSYLYILLFGYGVYCIIQEKKIIFYRFIVLILLFCNPFFFQILSNLIGSFDINKLIFLISLGGFSMINIYGTMKFYDEFIVKVFGIYSFVVMCIIIFMMVF